MVGGVQVEHAELALNEKDAGLDPWHRPQREVDDPLDRQRRRDLDDGGVLARARRVAASPGRRAEKGGELRLHARQQQMDTKLGHASLVIEKCLPSSACGRGITWTLSSSPIAQTVSAPASVAALTAPT